MKITGNYIFLEYNWRDRRAVSQGNDSCLAKASMLPLQCPRWPLGICIHLCVLSVLTRKHEFEKTISIYAGYRLPYFGCIWTWGIDGFEYSLVRLLEDSL